MEQCGGCRALALAWKVYGCGLRRSEQLSGLRFSVLDVFGHPKPYALTKYFWILTIMLLLRVFCRAPYLKYSIPPQKKSYAADSGPNTLRLLPFWDSIQGPTNRVLGLGCLGAIGLLTVLGSMQDTGAPRFGDQWLPEHLGLELQAAPHM